MKLFARASGVLERDLQVVVGRFDFDHPRTKAKLDTEPTELRKSKTAQFQGIEGAFLRNIYRLGQTRIEQPCQRDRSRCQPRADRAAEPLELRGGDLRILSGDGVNLGEVAPDCRRIVVQ